MRVGLLGGSFNPAHRGHVFISHYARKRLGLHQVWWLVSPQNPLKPAEGMAGLRDRLAGAERSARDPHILPTALEARLGTRFTAATLARLVARYPRTRFVWLMGADNLGQIHRWRDWERIFHLVAVAVLHRPSYSLRALVGKAARRFRRQRLPKSRARRAARRPPPVWVFLDNPGEPVSATAIRRMRQRPADGCTIGPNQLEPGANEDREIDETRTIAAAGRA